jgi:hypothetical protein
MKIDSRAGQPAIASDLVDVPKLIAAYYEQRPHPEVPSNELFSARRGIAVPRHAPSDRIEGPIRSRHRMRHRPRSSWGRDPKQRTVATQPLVWLSASTTSAAELQCFACDGMHLPVSDNERLTQRATFVESLITGSSAFVD